MRPAPIQRFGLLLFGTGFVLLFAVIAIAEGIGSPAVPAGDAAFVDGVAGDAGQITRAEFRSGLAQTIAQAGQKAASGPGSEAYEEARATTMERLLKAAWVSAQADEEGIAVGPTEVRAAIASFKQQQRFETAAQLKHYLAASHLSMAEFRLLARLQLLSGRLQERLLESVPPPSERAVSDYYETAKSTQFTTAPTYDLRLVLNFSRAKIARAKAALERDDSPATWKLVAARYSEDPAAKHSGGLHEEIPAEFGEPLDAAIAASPAHELQGILETKGTFFVFQVEGSKPARVEPLSEVRSHVVSQLTSLDRDRALEIFASEFESKWSSRTYCVAGFEVQGCAGFRGSGRPPNAPSACYEAHPKAGIAAPSCPAPVAQAVPAMPGTVSILSPKGTALPQRPHPAENP
jgi:parvulin-like peptidyl-prolyl isomerase